MMHRCRICLEGANSENAVKCFNCEGRYHYMCLGYDDNLIKGIKTGVITVLCPCIRGRPHLIEVDLQDEIDKRYDSSDEDEYKVKRLNNPGFTLTKAPKKSKRSYKKDAPSCVNGCEPNQTTTTKSQCKKCFEIDKDDDNDDADDPEELKEYEEDEETELVVHEKYDENDDEEEEEDEKCRHYVEKWCPKNPIDYSDEILAEEKHQIDAEKAALRKKPTIKKCQPKPSNLKVHCECNTEDVMKIKSELQRISKKTMKCGPTVKSSASTTDYVDSTPNIKPTKTMDQSVIEALENVCFTAKQLHVQIRELMCKIVCKK